MPRALIHRNSHTYGVLDPLMIERRDTKFVQNSLSDARNCVVKPQGGFNDRGGTDHIALARNAMSQVTVTAGLVTAPNGGTIANLIDGDTATTFVTGAVSATDPFVLFTVTFGAATKISAVDLINVRNSTSQRDDCLKVQYFSGGVWNDFGAPQNLRSTVKNGINLTHTRRYATSPLAADPTVTQWRAVVTGGSGVGTITIAGVKFFTELPVTDLASLGPAVLRRYSYSVDRFYVFVLTPGHMDIFRKDVWVGSVGMPTTAAMLYEVKHLPSDDTILFFHNDLEPWRVQRQGADDEWQSDPAPFVNVPLVDYGLTYTNGVNEIQVLRFFGAPFGSEMDLTLEGETTNSITIGPDGPTAANNIEAALDALPNTDNGITCTFDSGDSSYTVEFTGGRNAGKNWAEMVGKILTNQDGVVLIRTEQKGKPAGEAIFSTTRGYPAVGRYCQQRLILGGFKSRPKSFIMSNTGDIYNLDTERVGPTAARLYDIDDDDTNVIRDLHVGRSLLMFLDGSVWSMEFDILDADKTPVLIKSDAPGIIKTVRPTSIDNQLFYVQRGGETLRAMVFNEVEQNQLADNASVISASLMNNPVDSALRRAVRGNDADMLFLVLEDGTMLAITLMRTQDVSGFMPQLTAGLFKSVAVDAEETAWLIVQRAFNGLQRMCFERAEPAKVLDGAIDYTSGASTSLIPGLTKFIGQTVHVICDSNHIGEWLVPGSGTLNVAPNAGTIFRVGNWSQPYATDIPFYPQEEQKFPMAQRKRCYALELSLQDTTSIAVAANGDEPRNVSLIDFDLDEADTPFSLLPFSGRRRLEGLPGFTKTGQVTVTQLFPGKMTVRAVTKEMLA